MNKKLMLIVGVMVLAGCAAGSDSKPPVQNQHTQSCAPITEVEVASLFERWNASLQTEQPKVVTAHYAERSILLPTLSSVNRITKEEKEDYFTHFLESKPKGEVTARQIDIGCNMAADTGLYTFSMGSTGSKVEARYTFIYQWDGKEWLIISHHSSVLPSFRN